jgi:hypothetical protein
LSLQWTSRDLEDSFTFMKVTVIRFSLSAYVANSVIQQVICYHGSPTSQHFEPFPKYIFYLSFSSSIIWYKFLPSPQNFTFMKVTVIRFSLSAYS